ncbi:MAG: hypothetical protein FWD90_03035 [Defluviitaleaceae bacterium]|nr:hypothetical protein [Defluviitaleaceae bacterium]
MNISKVFDYARHDNKFPHHMSNFGHIFLDSADASLVCDEPPFYPDLPKSAYVFAAGFVHYWCDVFMLPVPEWVNGENYRFEEPYFNQPLMKDEIIKLTPTQFAGRNYFIPSSEVIYV